MKDKPKALWNRGMNDLRLKNDKTSNLGGMVQQIYYTLNHMFLDMLCKSLSNKSPVATFLGMTEEKQRVMKERKKNKHLNVSQYGV